MSRPQAHAVYVLATAALCAALVGCDRKQSSPEAPATAAATDSAARETAKAAAAAALDKASQPATAAASPGSAAPSPAAAPSAAAAPPVVAAPSAPAAAAAGDDAATDTGVDVKNTLSDRAKAQVSDGASLSDARSLVDSMAQEMKRAIAGLMMAKGDKAKVDRISEDFKSLNETMTKKLERVAEKLTPAEMVEFESYTKEQIGPLMNQLIQAFFQSGGLQVSDAAGAKGQTARLPVDDTPSAPGGTPTAAPATPTAAGSTRPPAPASAAGAPGSAAPAPAAPAKKLDLDSLPLTMANQKIDELGKRLKAVVVKIRAAGNDPDKLQAVNGEYQEINRVMGSTIPTLRQSLSDEQRPAFDAYVKAVLMPIAKELVQAFTAAGAVPTQQP